MIVTDDAPAASERDDGSLQVLGESADLVRRVSCPATDHDHRIAGAGQQLGGLGYGVR
jgi:hypothetical protein